MFRPSNPLFAAAKKYNGVVTDWFRKAANLEKYVKEIGWEESRQRGSHKIYTHPEQEGHVTIPQHKTDIPDGTVRSILEQARIDNIRTHQDRLQQEQHSTGRRR